MMRWTIILLLCALLATTATAAWSPIFARKAEPAPIAPEGDDQRTEHVLAILSKPAIGWEFMDAPLPKFATWLQQELQLVVRVDEPALIAANIDLQTLLSGKPQGVARDVALQRILGSRGMVWEIDGDELLITTASALPRNYTRLYPVKDLVQLRDREGNYDDGESLEDVVMACVDAKVWDRNSGLATAEFVPATHSLAVTAPLATQQKVERLLAGLRSLKQEQGGQTTFVPRFRPSPRFGCGPCF